MDIRTYKLLGKKIAKYRVFRLRKNQKEFSIITRIPYLRIIQIENGEGKFPTKTELEKLSKQLWFKSDTLLSDLKG